MCKLLGYLLHQVHRYHREMLVVIMPAACGSVLQMSKHGLVYFCSILDLVAKVEKDLWLNVLDEVLLLMVDHLGEQHEPEVEGVLVLQDALARDVIEIYILGLDHIDESVVVVFHHGELHLRVVDGIVGLVNHFLQVEQLLQILRVLHTA
jgi:hypothetical protein